MPPIDRWQYQWKPFEVWDQFGWWKNNTEQNNHRHTWMAWDWPRINYNDLDDLPDLTALSWGLSFEKNYQLAENINLQTAVRIVNEGWIKIRKANQSYSVASTTIDPSITSEDLVRAWSSIKVDSYTTIFFYRVVWTTSAYVVVTKWDWFFWLQVSDPFLVTSLNTSKVNICLLPNNRFLLAYTINDWSQKAIARIWVLDWLNVSFWAEYNNLRASHQACSYAWNNKIAIWWALTWSPLTPWVFFVTFDWDRTILSTSSNTSIPTTVSSIDEMVWLWDYRVAISTSSFWLTNYYSITIWDFSWLIVWLWNTLSVSNNSANNQPNNCVQYNWSVLFSYWHDWVNQLKIWVFTFSWLVIALANQYNRTAIMTSKLVVNWSTLLSIWDSNLPWPNTTMNCYSFSISWSALTAIINNSFFNEWTWISSNTSWMTWVPLDATKTLLFFRNIATNSLLIWFLDTTTLSLLNISSFQDYRNQAFWILKESWLTWDTRIVTLLWWISTIFSWLTAWNKQYIDTTWAVVPSINDYVIWLALSDTEVLVTKNL